MIDWYITLYFYNNISLHIMKKSFSILFAILISIINVFSQSKMKIAGADSVDWGTIYRGEKIQKTFAVQNVGKDTLMISNVIASCGCTAAMLNEKIIPPNKSGDLSITFNSENFTGKVHKTVTINSNDTSNASFNLQFNVNIMEEVSIEPRSVIFRDIKLGSPAKQTLKIKNTSLSPISILSWKSDDKNLEAKTPEKPITPNQEADIELTYTPKSSGYSNNMMELSTDAKHQSKVIVNFYVNAIVDSTKAK